MCLNLGPSPRTPTPRTIIPCIIDFYHIYSEVQPCWSAHTSINTYTLSAVDVCVAGAVTLSANRFLRPNSFLAAKLYQRRGHKSYPDLKPRNTCLSGHKVHQPGLTDQHEVREGGKNFLYTAQRCGVYTAQCCGGAKALSEWPLRLSSASQLVSRIAALCCRHPTRLSLN